MTYANQPSFLHKQRRKLIIGAVSAVALLVAIGLLIATPFGAEGRLGPAQAAPPSAIGFAEGGTLLDKSAGELDRDFAAMRSLGGSWIRVEVNWRKIESVPGQYNWGDVDRVVGAARRHGIQVLGLVTFAPQWAADPRGGNMPGSRPNNPQTFGAFAGRAAARYAGSISTWEVWNEPNLPLFFSPGPDVGLYGRVLRAAYGAIHAAKPGARVLTAGLSIANDTPTTIAPATFISKLYAQGLKGSFDGVALHPYTFPYTAQNDPNGNWADLSEVRSVMVKNGDADKKIWITEFGAPTGIAPDAVSDQQQAIILREAITSARALSYVGGPFFVYTLRDTGDNIAYREDNFGVLRRNWSHKPAADTIRSLATQ